MAVLAETLSFANFSPEYFDNRNYKERGQKKNGIMWEKFPNWGGEGGPDPNPLLDVYLPSYFWHAKMILRC